MAAKAEASRKFTASVLASANALLVQWVGPERAAEASGRIGTAFSAAALSARDPETLYSCTTASVGQCVAVAALTGIMPGTGPTALAYLVPRRPRKTDPFQLQYQLSHRGIAALARRAGLVILPLPVGMADKLEVDFGEISSWSCDIDNPPQDWDELRGVALFVKDANTGTVLFRGWVPKAIIERRRAQSDAYRTGGERSPWNTWPIEMAMKSAMHYAVSRGWAVIDDHEAARALSMDARSDAIDVEYEERPVEATTGTAALLGDNLDLEEEAPAEEEEKVQVETKTTTDEEAPL